MYLDITELTIEIDWQTLYWIFAAVGLVLIAKLLTNKKKK